MARHTYASAHFALHENAGQTAKELGHFAGLNTFRAHYYGLYTKDQAKEFFSIRPEEPTTTKLALPSAG